MKKLYVNLYGTSHKVTLNAFEKGVDSRNCTNENAVISDSISLDGIEPSTITRSFITSKMIELVKKNLADYDYTIAKTCICLDPHQEIVAELGITNTLKFADDMKAKYSYIINFRFKVDFDNDGKPRHLCQLEFPIISETTGVNGFYFTSREQFEKEIVKVRVMEPKDIFKENPVINPESYGFDYSDDVGLWKAVVKRMKEYYSCDAERRLVLNGKTYYVSKVERRSMDGVEVWIDLDVIEPITFDHYRIQASKYIGEDFTYLIGTYNQFGDINSWFAPEDLFDKDSVCNIVMAIGGLVVVLNCVDINPPVATRIVLLYGEKNTVELCALTNAPLLQIKYAISLVNERRAQNNPEDEIYADTEILQKYLIEMGYSFKYADKSESVSW